MSRLGIKIKDARQKKGITQKQLGKKLGVSEKYVDEIETGKRILNDELIKKVSSILEEDINDLMINDIENSSREKSESTLSKELITVNKKEIEKVWDDAFSSVLKSIPIFDYDLNTLLGSKQLPIVSNKIEGYPKDKVFYLKIKDDDMLGFRISKGDLALCLTSHDIVNNTICLVDYNQNRGIRQVKKLEKDKVLLISNKDTLKIETLFIKDIKVIARLERLEIKL